jgi:HK97 family phage prohead protease
VLLNHDPSKLLGRTANRTARLAVDTRGLRVEVDVPDTQDGRDTLTLVKRGDLSQMSFAFRVPDGGDRWRAEKEQTIRELLDVELFDVSLVTFPAYRATSVSARALEHARKVAPPLERLARQIQALELEI